MFTIRDEVHIRIWYCTPLSVRRKIEFLKRNHRISCCLSKLMWLSNWKYRWFSLITHIFFVRLVNDGSFSMNVLRPSRALKIRNIQRYNWISSNYVNNGDNSNLHINEFQKVALPTKRKFTKIALFHTKTIINKCWITNTNSISFSLILSNTSSSFFKLK